MTQPPGHESVDAAPNFDRLASIYRWLEWFSFGPSLSRCRLAFLDRVAGRRCALIMGDGDGRFTSRLVRANPGMQIDAVDASPAMLSVLMQRVGKHRARIRTHVADARSWQPSGDRRYDVVATHFFLDCLTTDEVRRLAQTIRPVLSPKALWVVSEFAVPDNLFGRLAAGPLVSALYRAFGVLTGLTVRRLPDYRAALARAGLRQIENREFLRGLLISEVWLAE
jgi:ubiquinone/menaquinone biosynthesis C-methylase UbiE